MDMITNLTKGLAEKLVQAFLRKAQDGIHEVGKDTAVEQWGYDPQEVQYQPVDSGQIGEDQPEQNSGNQYQKGSQAPLEIFIVSLQHLSTPPRSLLEFVYSHIEYHEGGKSSSGEKTRAISFPLWYCMMGW